MTRKSKRKNLKSVFFDLDGTLLDTVDGLYKIYLNFLNDFGKKGSKKEFKELNGPSINEVVLILKSKHQLPGTSQELYKIYQEKIQHYYENEAQVFPIALKLIWQLKSIPITIGLVTSASTNLTKLILKKHHLNDMFDVVVTGEMVDKSKPDPEIYLKALKMAKANSKNSIAIEDSLNGVNAAIAAGIHAFRLNPKIERVKWYDNCTEFKNWDVLNQFFNMYLQ